VTKNRSEHGEEGCCCSPFFRALTLLLAGGFGLTSHAAAGAEALVPGFSAEVVQRHSQWRESDAAGNELVRERGTLNGLVVGWNWRSSGFDGKVEWEGLQGTRHYDGQTNQGMAAQSSTDVRERAWTAQVNLPLGGHWSPGITIQPARVERTIANSGTAQGYTERWQWALVSAGLGWTGGFGPQAITLRSDIGAMLHSRLSVTLPGLDPATVVPRHGRLLRVGIDYQRELPSTSQWHWQLLGGAQWQGMKFDASEAVPLMSGGVLRGAVSQPCTRMNDYQWKLGLKLDWR
jgi:hypothetical protein